MKKVIIIGAIPNERAGECALDAAVAGVLARALTLITNKPSSVEDNLSAAQVLIEILGEDMDVDLSKEIFKRFCVGK